MQVILLQRRLTNAASGGTYVPHAPRRNTKKQDAQSFPGVRAMDAAVTSSTYRTSKEVKPG